MQLQKVFGLIVKILTFFLDTFAFCQVFKDFCMLFEAAFTTLVSQLSSVILLKNIQNQFFPLLKAHESPQNLKKSPLSFDLTN